VAGEAPDVDVAAGSNEGHRDQQTATNGHVPRAVGPALPGHLDAQASVAMLLQGLQQPWEGRRPALPHHVGT